MRHILVLLVVAIVALAIVFTLFRPDLLADTWLWIVGLIGPIIGIVQVTIKKLTTIFKSIDRES